ncbi:MAG: hypothetical protein M3N13_00760 [Candidatus Eremiobacteraeota bacterium]|nr:hypothetical protein [Candidatus Eremiobacteraeota bacterium]
MYRVAYMIMRSCKAVTLVLMGLLSLASLRAIADPVQPNPLYRSLESGKAAHDAGVFRGVVDDVDYAGATITIKTHGRNLVIAVVPSTAIYQGTQYGTFSDVHRGQSVEIAAYEVDGRLVAQTIRLR